MSPLWRRWDVLVAAALVGLAFVPGVERQGVDLAELPDRAMDALGWMLLLAQGATVALLQRRPAACLAVVGSAFGAYQLLGYPTTFAALGLLVCVVGAGALVRRHRRVTIACAAGGYVLLCGALTWVGSPTSLLDHVVFGLLLASLWVVGAWLHSRALAQRHRSAEAALAAALAERGRIARELHDVITHHVTAMVVQADAAQFAANDSERTRTTLATIGETGRAALTDLRGLLGALDAAADASPGDDSARMPAITDVEELVERARAGGQPVELAREGEPRTVDAASALAVIRVVQEALTNAIKHAYGAATLVRIRYEEKEIDVTVTTETATAPGLGSGSGHGLIGLRERIALVGGRFEAGRVGTGFVVHARIDA
ncbi:sensor histidine kinase [Microbacterium sp.]|uniref:sensor histidine kinase n=1 Tax=Microbacterium sp. TaxID=51671 RepID=UPI0027348897|nr:histidine kinase [Microbacterium sp.]